MMLNLSGPMIRPKSGAPQYLVVLLHGYGSDGQDLIGLAPLFADLLPEALYVAPNAPQSCDLGAGYQWFPVVYDTELRGFDGIEPVRPVIMAFLEGLWEETGLGPAETFLVGFSQGAMIALDTGLHLRRDLAGILAFSGGTPLAQTPDLRADAKTPVCLIHGDSDEIVPIAMSRRADMLLREAGRDVTFHISAGTGHGIAPDGIEVARRFVADHMPQR
jgi:phospholipase/carboxylesterase